MAESGRYWCARGHEVPADTVHMMSEVGLGPRDDFKPLEWEGKKGTLCCRDCGQAIKKSGALPPERAENMLDERKEQIQQQPTMSEAPVIGKRPSEKHPPPVVTVDVHECAVGNHGVVAGTEMRRVVATELRTDGAHVDLGDFCPDHSKAIEAQKRIPPSMQKQLPPTTQRYLKEHDKKIHVGAPTRLPNPPVVSRTYEPPPPRPPRSPADDNHPRP